MPKFRKKPVVIEAVQWFGHEPWVEGMETHPRGDFSGPCIKTLEGYMAVRSGDWIITGIVGEKYPCKPEIFEKTHEPVDESHPAKGEE